MAFNSSKKLAGNIDALRIAFSGQENYSPEEIEVLKDYAGFGGIKAVLFGGYSPSAVPPLCPKGSTAKALRRSTSPAKS